MKRSRDAAAGRKTITAGHFELTGPDVKIRGTAAHVYEKYLQLARDAGSAGDRVMAENYLQHAEHYFRILLAQGICLASRNPGGPQANGSGDGRVPTGSEQPGYVQPAGSAPSFSLAEARTISKKVTRPPDGRSDGIVGAYPTPRANASPCLD